MSEKKNCKQHHLAEMCVFVWHLITCLSAVMGLNVVHDNIWDSTTLNDLGYCKGRKTSSLIYH